MTEPLTVQPGNAKLFHTWLQERGGLAVWPSINLSDPGKSVTTPRNKADGQPATKPAWWTANEPNRIVTDPAEVVVEVSAVFKRFHVGVRMDSQGMSLKVTDGGTRKIWAAVAQAKAKHGSAWYEFDYGTQDVVIYYASEVVPLTEWLARETGA